MRLRKSIDRRRKRASVKWMSPPNDRRWSDKRQADAGEQRFVELINSTTQAFLIHSLDYQPLLINQGYADLLGYTMDELVRINDIHYFYNKNDFPRIRGSLSFSQFKPFQKNKPTVYEAEARHKNGSTVIVQHAASQINWRGEEAVLIAVNDISEKFYAQQALELSEQRFRDFAESASDWSWEMNEDFRFIFMSESFERITGCQDTDIVGLTRQEFASRFMNTQFVSEEEKNNWRQHQKVLESRKPFSDYVYRWYRNDGSYFVMTTNGKPIYDNKGVFKGYRGVAKDITSEKSLSEQLRYQATHDELTGLINRACFDSELHNTIDDALIDGEEHVLVYMDLDRFKIVNDTCGHVAGDALLQQLARLFQTIFCKNDVLARLGGDEFAVIMRHCSIDQSMLTTQRLHEAMDNFRFVWDKKPFSVGVSVGIVTIDRNSESVTRLMQNVDSACFKAKHTGRNKTQIFSENDEDLSRRQGEMRWTSRITQALEDDAFTIFAQAIVPLQGDCGRDDGVFYELLIRMRDGDQIVAPEAFLPAAERYDLSLILDKWMLRQAIQWADDHRALLANAQLLFINLSGKTIGQKSFMDFAIRLLEEHQVPTDKICFEITETSAITNLAEANDFITKLKNIGCYFALDDFGSGVSSFAYLKNLPVDFLKIDGMFIRDMCSNAVNLAMVKSINEISHVMGKKTIAEFVEDESTFAVLRSMGVDFAQGYGIHRPQPLSDVTASCAPLEGVSEGS